MTLRQVEQVLGKPDIYDGPGDAEYAQFNGQGVEVSTRYDGGRLTKAVLFRVPEQETVPLPTRPPSPFTAWLEYLGLAEPPDPLAGVTSGCGLTGK
jgi:hypothetical protein